MTLETTSHYNSNASSLGLNLQSSMPTNPAEQSRSSKSPTSQGFPFAGKFASPMFQYAQGIPTPGYFPGLYPTPDFSFLPKTPPIASQIAPLPPFPMTRPLTPPAALKVQDKFAFEPENYEASPQKRNAPTVPEPPKTEEEIIEEELAEDEFQKNFVDALRKSGRLETAEKVIKARQQHLEERGRLVNRGDNSRPGHSPGASSSRSSNDGESRKAEDVPDWFARAQQEVAKEREEARKSADHFEKQMARFGLGKPKESPSKSLELPPPYDKLDLENREHGSEKKEDPYANSTDEETEKPEIETPKNEIPKMSALDDVLNDVIAKSREMTEQPKENENEMDVSRDSGVNQETLDSSREDGPREYDDMHMARTEDAPEPRDNPESSSREQHNQSRSPYYSGLSQSYPYDKNEPHERDYGIARDYPYSREDRSDIKQEHQDRSPDKEDEQKDDLMRKREEPHRPHGQDLDLFRAMGLKSDNEMEDFHRMMAMKARQMMMDDKELGGLRPGGLATSMAASFASSMAPMHSLPSGSMVSMAPMGSGLPLGYSSRLMDRAREEGAPLFPGMAPEMMPFMLPGDDKDGRKEIFFCHLCSYTGTSKFHFNAHMNSHFEHRCPHCDYTSRTEGRLKRHIKDFHIDNNGQPSSGQKTMRNNTPGRPKVYRCKQCEFVANTKVEFWVHARIHIKAEKVLQCPKCPFVTEYKHHLEYHLRNHFGSKPYKCSKCNYSCVNKSMLNSHMKSHTNVYQYRCADCTYATKYCHSLKLHLRKYNHKPATILNSDGSLPLEDSKGQTELMKNRDRGPRTIPRPQAFKRLDMEPSMISGPENGLPRLSGMNGALVPPMYWPVLNNGMHQLPPPLLPVGNMVPIPSQLDRGLGRMPMDPNTTGNSPFKCKLCCYDAEDKEGLNKHMLKVHAAENQDLFSAFGITSDSLEDEARHNGNGDESHPRGSPPDAERSGALDLSKPMDLSKSPELTPQPYNRKRRLLEHCLTPQPEESAPSQLQHDEQPKPEFATPQRKRSRKGKAFKLDTTTMRMQEDEFLTTATETDDFNRTEDYGYTSDEPKDDDQSKVPDFSEVHENLRNLNQGFKPNDRFVYANEAMRSPFQQLNAFTNSIESHKERRVEEKSSEREQSYIKTESQAFAKSDSPAYCKPESPYRSDTRKSDSPYKLDSPRQQNGGTSDNEDSSSGRDASSPEATSLPNGHNIRIKGDFFECQYCEIAFRDCVLYTMHMGYHGFKDAFHCNNCGYQGKDKVDFFLHIARIAHM